MRICYNRPVRWLLFALMLGCSDDSPREPAPEPPSDPPAPASPRSEAPDEEEERAAAEPPGCLHLVLDEEPPLRVRAEPSARSEAVATLANGSSIRVLEVRGSWARFEGGWVYRRHIYDTCVSPPAVPVLPLGPKAYLIVEGWHDATGGPRVRLPDVPMELASMAMHRGALNAVEPVEVTLVTKLGSCVREVTQRTTITGSCPEYSSQTTALVVDGCAELMAGGDDRPHLTEPLMVAVFGAHPGSRLEEWPLEKSEPSEALLAQLRPRPLEIGDHVRFDGGRWSWLYADGEHHLFDRGRRVDSLDVTATEPMRVMREGRFLVGVGNQGFHGYGFYMFPRAGLPQQARELAYEAFTCGAY
ncbi:MAG: hypothetical protein CMN30_22215 [Sandaracinus sp.]|nr:hypothetical protein [Sandaracinus sp.]|tara:strand:+ start:1086 stop:2162 length:1077 start_codon:yes stop_codon:yes gene_type:complete